MKEIGGYIELDDYQGKMLYDDGIKLNCGRKALEYVVKAKRIKKILMPKFMCDSCDKVFRNNGVEVKYYSIGIDFKPIISKRQSDEWLYIVNFYGQLGEDEIKNYGEKVICDNAQAYFVEPIAGIDTLYTCRKFFGVADGAILYTDVFLTDLQQDESYDRMNYLLGRYERSASEFYQEYAYNNDYFENQPIKKMSKLTENLLHGIDYEFVKKRRTENFTYLNSKLLSVNKLSLRIPEGPFMYPLYVDDGAEIRKKLQAEKIYIPTLWPSVFNICEKNELEYNMAENILPLPVDQRYMIQDMDYMVRHIMSKI